MDYSGIQDAELARLVRENAPDAFAELSARYLGLIRMKAALFEGPAAPERDDLFQEGFLGLYIAAVSYSEKRGASFRTYAGVCVYNRMADAARRHGSLKNKALNESLSLDSEAASRITAGSGPEDLLELRDQVQALLSRLNMALSPLERKALSLYLGGCKRTEVEARGLSLKAFDNAMHRVRSKLKSAENPAGN